MKTFVSGRTKTSSKVSEVVKYALPTMKRVVVPIEQWPPQQVSMSSSGTKEKHELQ